MIDFLLLTLKSLSDTLRQTFCIDNISETIAEENIDIPFFTEEILNLLLNRNNNRIKVIESLVKTVAYIIYFHIFYFPYYVI